MYKNKTILAVIPARGGSKRIPNKNIKPLAGKPLIAYTIQSALKSKIIDRLIVSTDSPKIAKIAKKYGAEAPFLRPTSLAQDTTPTLPVIQHAIKFLAKKEKWQPDIVVILQPTSPLRKAQDINQAVRKLIEQNCNTCLSLCEISERPEWMYSLAKERLKPFIKSVHYLARRQDLPKVFYINGAVCAVKTDVVMKKNKLNDEKSATAIIMPRERSVDIDEPFDFKLSELLLNIKCNKRLKNYLW